MEHYCPVIISDEGRSVTAWWLCYDYLTGPKLMDHSFVGNTLVTAVEVSLMPNNIYHNSRIIWANKLGIIVQGGKNLYDHAMECGNKQNLQTCISVEDYPYIVNHTKNQCVKKGSRGDIHPLPLLTAEINPTEFGDRYITLTNLHHVGLWSGDVLSLEKVPPEGCTLLSIEFIQFAH